GGAQMNQTLVTIENLAKDFVPIINGHLLHPIYLVEKFDPHRVTQLLIDLNFNINEKCLDQFPKLKKISTVSVGTDHIDLDLCRRRQIAVHTTPDVLTEPTADLALALALALNRQVIPAYKDISMGYWQQSELCKYVGKDLRFRNLGIFGFG